MKRYQYVLGMNGKMIDKKNRSLLILGNGFDLQCGLNTTYDNFFNLKFGIIWDCKIVCVRMNDSLN